MSVTSESGTGMDDTWGIETAGSGSLTSHQLRAHARHEEHTAMSPRWVAANRLFISPTSLKYNMAFPGENQFSAVDPITGAPLTMHRHLRNSRNRSRWTPTFMWNAEEDILDDSSVPIHAMQSSSTVSSSSKGASLAQHFPGAEDQPNGGSTVTSVQRSAIPPTPPTLEQAMRGDFGFTTAGGATSYAGDSGDGRGGAWRPYYGSHQFLPPYMLKKRGGRVPGGSQTARAHRPKTDFSTRRASPLRGVSTGGFDGGDSRGQAGSSSPNREVYSPPATARARTARPVLSTFGTSGQWQPPSPPPPPSQPKSARGGVSGGEAEMRERMRGRQEEGLGQYLLPPGRHVVWRPKTTPGPAKGVRLVAAASPPKSPSGTGAGLSPRQGGRTMNKNGGTSGPLTGGGGGRGGKVAGSQNQGGGGGAASPSSPRGGVRSLKTAYGSRHFTTVSSPPTSLAASLDGGLRASLEGGKSGQRAFPSIPQEYAGQRAFVQARMRSAHAFSSLLGELDADLKRRG